jgi:hypothetical protein
MSDAPKNCTACNGRGYIRCACWPGDCICGQDDIDCEACDGTGQDDAWDDFYIGDDTRDVTITISGFQTAEQAREYAAAIEARERQLAESHGLMWVATPRAESTG